MFDNKKANKRLHQTNSVESAEVIGLRCAVTFVTTFPFVKFGFEYIEICFHAK